MKLIHISDQHLGIQPEKAAVSFEHLYTELFENQESEAYRPDIIVSTGDLTDQPLHVHSKHLRPFLDFVKRVPTAIPIVMLQGTPSHEQLGTIRNLADLSEGQIVALESPTQHYRLDTRHEFLDTEGDSAIIRCLPALTKPQLAKWCAEIGLGVDAFSDPVEAARMILSWIGEQWQGFTESKILLGHWTVRGCTTATGQTLHGGDIDLSLEDIALAGADVALLGHIHNSQTWEYNGSLIRYAGSTFNCNWGELDQKSFGVLNFLSGQLGDVTEVFYPHRPMVKVELEFTGEQDASGKWKSQFIAADEIEWGLLPKAEVKAAYTIPRAIAASVDDLYVRALFAEHGVELAAVERTIKAETRERIDGIGILQTTAQQYGAVCQARGVDARPGAVAKAELIDEVGVGR